MASEPTIIEILPFMREREKHLDDQDFQELQFLLISDPERGDVIQGSGGVRKVRFKSKDRSAGKSGGIRVVYISLNEKGKIYLLWIIDKKEQKDLTPEQAKRMAFVAKTVKGE